ncbi:hypothetical protein BHM03_00000405 [Ensete ventricosum]|nr:hypothetical protein BHM03_00000405 [Ensete ventricosum]
MPSDDHPSRLFYELCALLLAVLRTPHLSLPPYDAGASPPAPARIRQARPRARMSPAGFASLLLGASLALMLCGSVTFVIGFIMMPWVVGLVILFYFMGIVSNLSGLGRAILCPGSGPSSPKETSVSYSSLQRQSYILVPVHVSYLLDYVWDNNWGTRRN